MATKVQLPYHFEPREYQLPFLKAMATKKRACLVWHRRCGKDKTALNFTVNEMFKRKGAYYYIFPTLKQGRKVIWDGMDYTGFKFMDHFPPEIVKRKREDEMKIELVNGSIFQLVGSDNFDAAMGTNPVGLIMDEYSLHDPRAWQYLRPILLENKGWVVFLYTPRGKNHGYYLYKKALELSDTWHAEILTANDTKKPDGTPVFTEEDIKQERAEGMDEDMIQQEYFCSFEGGLAGQIYGRLMSMAREDGRVTEVPHNPDLPVFTFWDIGINDYAAIWFMQFPLNKDRVNVIRYYQNDGEAVGHYIEQLEHHRIRDHYVYRQHFAPHDFSKRDFGHGESPEEVARKLGYTFTVVERTTNIQHGIQNVRSVIPKMWFDLTNCGLGIDALENYRKAWDPKYKRYTDTPVKDWAAHGADAARTYAEGRGLEMGLGMTTEQARALHDKYVAGETPGPLDDFFDEEYDIYG